MIKFSVPRESLLRPLQLVTGVVERRQTLPVLANLLVVLKDNQISLTGTDLEVELVGRFSSDSLGAEGEITIPAKKLMDIVKSLPDDAVISLAIDDAKAVLTSGRSRFTLTTLPASDFPSVEDEPDTLRFTIEQQVLKKLIDATSFAMAQQDVRYYLNGMLLELTQDRVRTVATDGHRLALSTAAVTSDVSDKRQVIVPRKGILELARLLGEGSGEVEVALGNNHIRVRTPGFTFTSKLVDGKFPDYERVLPRGGDKKVIADRAELKSVFGRAAILSNEKYRGVRLVLETGNLQVLANNPEQEEAEENLAVDYEGDNLEVGFNVNYLLDVFNHVQGEQVQFLMADSNSSALLQDAEDSSALYVVMPMRL
jgi:DNA polymerase-3 subunit beta